MDLKEKQMKSLIYPLRQYLATELGRVMTCSGGLTFEVTWTFDYVVTWQIQKSYICSFAIPMATQIGRVVTWGGEGPYLVSHVTFWLRALDKLKKFIFALSQYLWTWQGGGGKLPSEDPTYLARWRFGNVVTWKIQNTYTCSSAVPMATELGRVRTSSGGNLPSKSRDLLIV